MVVFGSVSDFRLSHGVVAAMPARKMREVNMMRLYTTMRRGSSWGLGSGTGSGDCATCRGEAPAYSPALRLWETDHTRHARVKTSRVAPGTREQRLRRIERENER
jgi:hypothetical protein